ncbi:MAG: hypothetical protein BWY78_00969 [Alphaproteobacteria bacterium ADurb.Bin438]|nr:MAG: hypothetical protein BWY78_00969 [Alphaproteobacteria bacterium ADurb.Bin438]
MHFCLAINIFYYDNINPIYVPEIVNSQNIIFMIIANIFNEVVVILLKDFSINLYEK